MRSVPNALRRVEAAFEFMTKLGVEYYTFHDRDVAPEGKTLVETNANLDVVGLPHDLSRARAPVQFPPSLTRFPQPIVSIRHAGALLSCGLDHGQITASLSEHQRKTGIKLLWGTANLFSHPRYCCGAGTSPDFAVYAHAAAQVKKAMDVTLKLGGALSRAVGSVSVVAASSMLKPLSSVHSP